MLTFAQTREQYDFSAGKLERVAMEEVRTGVIQYTLPTNYEGSPRGIPRE